MLPADFSSWRWCFALWNTDARWQHTEQVAHIAVSRGNIWIVRLVVGLPMQSACIAWNGLLLLWHRAIFATATGPNMVAYQKTLSQNELQNPGTVTILQLSTVYCYAACNTVWQIPCYYCTVLADKWRFPFPHRFGVVFYMFVSLSIRQEKERKML